MFIEIRNVETGSLAQVIQGNNLRCLFAETPAVIPLPPRASYPGYQQGYYSPPQQHQHQHMQLQQQQQHPYAHSSHAGRSSVSVQSAFTTTQYPSPPAAPHTGRRDEIIMVSDDRVLKLTVQAPGP